MKRDKISCLLAVSMSVCLLAAGLAGCSSAGGDSADRTEQENAAKDGASQESGEETEILVAAAASLEYAYEEELIPMFEEQNPGVTVKGTYDSSGKLQTQIEEGLEADVFMSAATQQMDALTEEGFIDGDSVKDLLENQIELITSADNELGLAEFTDITKADTIAIGDPASVPDKCDRGAELGGRGKRPGGHCLCHGRGHHRQGKGDRPGACGKSGGAGYLSGGTCGVIRTSGGGPGIS